MRQKSDILQTTQNTPQVMARIAHAARKKKFRHFNLWFEHGQWWLIVETDDPDILSGEIVYSVVDAEGGSSVNGFDFERVS